MIYFDLKEYAYDQDGEQGKNNIDIDKMPLMQFTGLLDKTGKEIYEGDIIHRCNGYDWIVEWSDKLLAIAIRRLRNKTHPYLDEVYATLGDTLQWDGVKVEVLGNIYENPELLDPK